uniref:ubiquitinyl hydrolase 1 n=1 Tax=Xenopsylla cheopis TaxID=163159 RepID=A0A6M2DMQ2_XENCH
MEVIFHEKQDGRLCAQHCLNALLQGPYFSAIELSELANRLDDEEREQMAENGIDSDEYRQFLEQPSNNLDDTGYFSVQVISKALSLWGLELVNYCSSEPEAMDARTDPCRMKAFICNHQNHWFCVRRFGSEWFNLNSLLSGPKYMSDTYLTEFLNELQSSGYTIFIISGIFPQCDADKLVNETQVSLRPTITHTIPSEQPALLNGKEHIIPITLDADHPLAVMNSNSSHNQIEQESIAISSDEDEDLQKAISLSLEGENHKIKEIMQIQNSPADDEDLQAALRLSLECFSTPVTPDGIETADCRLIRVESDVSGAQN